MNSKTKGMVEHTLSVVGAFIVILLIVLAMTVITGCAATITITTTDPATGVVDKIDVTSARRTAISTPTVTVITGQVLINDETVQVLGKTVAPVIVPQK